MTQVNLRRDRNVKMTVEEGDESLVHLSNVQFVTSPEQLHTGGKYRTEGTFAVDMPTDGNNVEIHVTSGQLTLTGLVDGVTNPALSAGPNREYVRVGSEWRLLPGSGGLGKFTSYTQSATASVNNPLMWFDTAAGAVCTLPAGLPNDTTFGIVRGGASALRVVGESDDIYVNDVTDPEGVDFNERGRIAWFRKAANGWSVAT